MASGRYLLIAESEAHQKAFSVVDYTGSHGFRIDLMIFPITYSGSGILFGRVLELVNVSKDASDEEAPTNASSANAPVVSSLMELADTQWGACFCMGPFGFWHFGVNSVKVILTSTQPHPPTRLSGHVIGLSENSDSDAAPVPIAGALVTARPNFPHAAFGPVPALTTVTDDSGFYEFSDLPVAYMETGEVVFSVRAAADGYISATRQTTVVPGEQNIFDFRLVPRSHEPASLSGHVRDGLADCAAADCNVPVPGAEVYLYFAVWPGDVSINPRFKAICDENGFYKFEELPDGI